VLIPIWLQKSFGAWTAFGGGGVTLNPGGGNRDFATYGLAIQRQLTGNFALGVEIFGATRSSVDADAATAVGFGAIYDVNDNWHLIGSINTGVVDRRESDEISYNFALKWTI
jgi:hypothetical protein